MECSLPGSPVYGILQARILEWVAIPFSGIFPTQGSNPDLPYYRQILYHLSHQEAQIYYQFSSVAQSCPALFDPMNHSTPASLSITNSRSSLRLASIESVMPSSHLILCRPLLLLPPIPPSVRVFCNESSLHMRWPKYWSFSFSIIPSKEIARLISFRMNWLDLLAVQETLESSPTPQFKSINFFGTQLSSPSNSHIHT